VIPIGGLLTYIGVSAPNSAFVLPFGQAISRTTYATLFALTGTTFGPGDGSTTFNVPDLRGRAVCGQDNMGGSAAERITVVGEILMGRCWVGRGERRIIC
jgi:microcystin-dependent protein